MKRFAETLGLMVPMGVLFSVVVLMFLLRRPETVAEGIATQILSRGSSVSFLLNGENFESAGHHRVLNHSIRENDRVRVWYYPDSPNILVGYEVLAQ